MNGFLQLVNMTLGASAVIGIVLVLRLLLRRAPKKLIHLLWGVVLLRLLCPWTLELPRTPMPARQIVAESSLIERREEISLRSSADAALRAVGDTLNGGIDPVYVALDRPELHPEGTAEADPAPAVSVRHGQVWLLLLGKVYPIGLGLMLAYTLWSLLRLRRQTAAAIGEGEGIWMADHLSSPFVWGLWRPRIYLPSDLPEEERAYILLHERTHIARFDHITRPLAWGALCIHWFNPLVWLAFYLSGRDMEMACDEAVLDRLGSDIRKDYCTSLVRFAEGPRLPGVTFSEGNVEGRVRNLLQYKKPALWLMALVVVLILLLGLFMLTSGKNAVQEAQLFREGIETAITDACAGHWGNMVQESYGSSMLTDGIKDAEILPADPHYNWDLFEYQTQLSWGERTCRFGWSPAMPDGVYGQWIEGGSYTQPVWIRSREAALGVIYGITRWDSDCGNTMHFQKVENGRRIKDYTFDDYVPMNVLASALAECTPTDRAPICGDGKLPETIDYYTIDVEGYHGTAQHAYAFCIYPDESYETWYVEVPGERVYAVTDSVRWMLEHDLNNYDSFLYAPTLTIRSEKDEITVDPVLPARLGESFLWIQTLETVPNEHGIPFAAYDEDGAKIDDMRIQVRIRSQGRAETTISDSLSRYHGSLGKLYPALEKGETYSVDLTLTLGGNKTNASYRFNIIPQ
ncbi:MAG: hypothetical protein IJF79_00395 [Clostridia bacterium]|nr:hypothetical protein [Clostridia bacterium]